MEVKHINIYDFKKAYKNLGVDKGGIEILNSKSKYFYFFIKNISSAGANILKQDCLSIGAELATPKETINCKKDMVDCILIANKKQLKHLIKKEKIQPFGLKTISDKLKEFLQEKNYPIKLMGIINANNDSFYKNSRFLGDNAIKAIYKMVDNGADIIDIGGVSSRPGSEPVNKKIELKRIMPICDIIKKEKLFKNVDFSIDSYTPEVVEYALNCGFKIVNDITGLKDNNIAKLVKKYNSKIVIMHMQGTPKSMQNNPVYNDVILDVEDFFEKQIKKALSFGIEQKNIILDIGIGFGKKLEHNIELIKNLIHFKKFGCEILVGASRKSMIDMISPSKTEDRLAGSIALHLEAINNGASIIRCHDIYEHKQAITIQQILRKD